MNENLPIIKVTAEELRQNPPELFKKFILINSNMYTDEAYEYLLDLVNKTDSVAFIQDTRKIYTHGEYFGGDLWADDLYYFSTFQILDYEANEIISEVYAEKQRESLRLSGLNNITIIPEEEYKDGIKYKTIKFGYDIAKSIDNSIVTIDDSTAQYNLEIKDEKISINKYIPIRVELPNLRILEYDSKIDTIDFSLDIIGTDENKNVFVTSSTNDEVILSDDYTHVTTNISNLQNNINFLILYSDSKTQGSINLLQKVGFGLVYSNEEITQNNFKELERFINFDNCDCDFILDIDDEQYGWFACPSTYNILFIDRDSNISGGWKKISKLKFYSLNIEYTLYRTEQSGLGHTKWFIKTIFD